MYHLSHHNTEVITASPQVSSAGSSSVGAAMPNGRATTAYVARVADDEGKESVMSGAASSALLMRGGCINTAVLDTC